MLRRRLSARLLGCVVGAATAVSTVGCTSELPTPPRLAQIELHAGDGQTGVVGTVLALPLEVKVSDQYGDAVTGALILFASTSFRLGGMLGVQTVSATLPGLTPVSFVANATPGPPAKITIAGGDGQSAPVGAPLPLPLRVLVTDGLEHPLSGIPISFTVLVGGGSISPAQATTDDNGIATTNWILGAAAGTQTVVAGFGTLTPVTFSATALAQQP